MQELVSRLTGRTGISEPQAREAIGIIVGFLKDAGPPDKVSRLVAVMPEIADVRSGPPGSFAGMLGAMGALNALSSTGLEMSQIQRVTKELIAHARRKAGAELVDDIVRSIPGLGQFV